MTTNISRATGLTSSRAIKAAVRAASTGPLTLYGEQSVDGISLVAGDRVLVKNQTSAVENGIYRVVASAAWEREPDFDDNRDVGYGTLVFIIEGATNGEDFYHVTANTSPIIIGTTPITFAKTVGSVAGQVAAAQLAQAGAEAAEDGAEDWADLAMAFANAAEDTEVLPGLYSAFHWSEKAKATASNAFKVSVDDTTPGFLEGKLLVGHGLVASTQNDGANETRTIAVKADQGGNIAADTDTTYTIVYTDGVMRKITFTDDCTLAFTFPASTVASILLELVDAGDHTITWPGTMQWAGQTVPDFTSGGTDHIVVYADGAGTITGAVIALDVGAP